VIAASNGLGGFALGRSLAVLLEAGDEPLGVGGLAGGAGSDALVVMDCCAGVVQGVAGTVIALEQESHVEPGLAGSVDVPAGFMVLDGLLVVVQGLPSVPGSAVDVAELVVGDSEIGGVVGGSGPGPAGDSAARRSGAPATRPHPRRS
jgi:hypothetical protein